MSRSGGRSARAPLHGLLLRHAFVSLIIAVLCVALLPAASRADFGEALVYEAVDLNEANQQADPEDVRSMESLLHWAIANSDHEELARQAEGVRKEELLDDLKQKLEEKRARVRELRQYMDSQVTETQLIKEAIGVLVRSNATAEERLVALQDLQPLVEPIDNANDLKPLGGIVPIVEHLFFSKAPVRAPDGTDAENGATDGLRAAAAFVLGSAASNNVKFQQNLLDAFPDVFERLIELSLAKEEEVAIKGVYAVASMVRNLQHAQRAFADAGGYGALEQLMSGPGVSTRIKRKVMSLVMDLSQMTHGEEAEAAGGRGQMVAQEGLLVAVLQLLGEEDLDMVEKSLGALKALLLGQDRAQAAESFRRAGAGPRLTSLGAWLHAQRTAALEEAGQQADEEEDQYLAYLVAQCQQVQGLLDQVPEAGDAAGAAPAAGGRAPRGTAGRGSRARGTGAEKEEEEQGPPLQLGHAEL